MEDFDYIIAGGGCAGLSLAARINRTDLKTKRILILDTEPKSRNDKTWCFWSEGNENIFTPYKGWSNLHFHTSEGSYTQDILPMRYQFVSSIEFYQSIYQELEANPNVEFRYERVLALSDAKDGAFVHTNQGKYKAQWVFNSINFPFQKKDSRTFYLAQHFYGWFVEMEEKTFDKDFMTLMDFRMKQNGETCFVYTLPFSDREALIEYTVFSETVWETERYKKELHQYLSDSFPGKKFKIVQEEQGVIPMTNHHFPRKKGKYIYNIGTAGGFTKATTGYTFKNIQLDTENIVQALLKTGKPHYRLDKKGRFGFYDNLLLHIIKHRGGIVHRIFHQLFSKNDFRTILNFLSEQTNILQEIWIMGRLPWGPFLNAIWQYYILRKPLENSLEVNTKINPGYEPKTTETI
ncbi:MAG: lycopene cyclase family protein [Bacteroidia bacterium]|nr:lycopene cyclase family protein [Bacteroidia bacterium]